MNKTQCAHRVSTQVKAKIKNLKSAARYWWDPEGIPVISMILTATILVIYIVAKAAGWNEDLIKILGLNPKNIHSYLTYSVVHEDTQHVIENSLLMLLLGPSVERAAGRKPYALMVISLVLMSSVAVVILAQDHWTKYGNPVGLSTVTFALITAFAYTASLNIRGTLGKTIANQLIAVTISTITCAILIYGAFLTNGSASLVGHITAFLGGTIAAGSIAFVRSRSQKQSEGIRQDI